MILDFNQQVTFAIDAPTSKYDGQRYSYEEYKKALTEPIEYADPTDHEDPRYYKKHAHTMPPLEAYFILTPGWNSVNTELNNKAVRSVFDWNNLTQYEIDQIEKFKKQIRSLEVEIPHYITDATLLKYVQGEDWDMKKAASNFVD